MKKANPAAVGAFVLGAIALVIVGVIALGSGNLFRETQRYVLFFDGSVNGLTVGSPVKIRGVEIGSVLEVNAIANPKQKNVLNEVIIQTDPNRFKRVGPVVGTAVERANRLVEEGVRARLETQSFVTGQLYVDFDFHPDTPVVLRGLPSEYPELPTIPSLSQEVGATLRDLMTRLRSIPIESIAKNLDGTLAGVDKIVNSPDLNAAIAQVDDAVKDLRSAVTEARSMLADAAKLVDDVDAEVEPLVASAVRVLDRMDGTLATVEGAVEPGADLRYGLNETLDELAEAARAIRRLADFVERNPNSLVFGRSSGDGE